MRDDFLRPMLNGIGRLPLLTPEEEILCGKAIQAAAPLREPGLKLTKAQQRILRRADKAKERLITGNLRLVVSIAKRYQQKCSNLHMTDLIQEGSLGLIRAAELFDPGRGYKFSTYCYWWIRQGIWRGINNQDRTIRRPAHICEMANRLPKVIAAETQRLGRPPVRAEIAAALKVPESELELLAERGSPTYSLDSLYAVSQDSTLLDHVADPSSLDQTEAYELLDLEMAGPRFEACFARLTETERQFITLRYGLGGDQPWTLSDIGATRGVTRERARQVINKAAMKLRVALRQHGLAPGDNRTDAIQTSADEATSDLLNESQPEEKFPRLRLRVTQAPRCNSSLSSERTAA